MNRVHITNTCPDGDDLWVNGEILSAGGTRILRDFDTVRITAEPPGTPSPPPAEDGADAPPPAEEDDDG